jgi:hypothetical protein
MGPLMGAKIHVTGRRSSVDIGNTVEDLFPALFQLSLRSTEYPLSLSLLLFRQAAVLEC